MEDASLLDVGGEAEGDLVEVAAEDGAVPHGGGVVDRDLPREDGVGGDERVDGDLGYPLPERDDLPLAPVVPPHPIPRDRRRSRRRRLRRRRMSRRRRRLGGGGEGEAAAEEGAEGGGGRG